MVLPLKRKQGSRFMGYDASKVVSSLDGLLANLPYADALVRLSTRNIELAKELHRSLAGAECSWMDFVARQRGEVPLRQAIDEYLNVVNSSATLAEMQAARRAFLKACREAFGEQPPASRIEVNYEK